MIIITIIKIYSKISINKIKKVIKNIWPIFEKNMFLFDKSNFIIYSKTRIKIINDINRVFLISYLF